MTTLFARGTPFVANCIRPKASRIREFLVETVGSPPIPGFPPGGHPPGGRAGYSCVTAPFSILRDRSGRITVEASVQWGGATIVITIGIICLIVGFIFGIGFLWAIGIVLLVIGIVLALLGMAGREVAGRRHYY